MSLLFPLARMPQAPNLLQWLGQPPPPLWGVGWVVGWWGGGVVGWLGGWVVGWLGGWVVGCGSELV